MPYMSHFVQERSAYAVHTWLKFCLILAKLVEIQAVDDALKLTNFNLKIKKGK